jgi:hypothetical protein
VRWRWVERERRGRERKGEIKVERGLKESELKKGRASGEDVAMAAR